MSTSFAGNPLGASRNPIPRHRTIVRLFTVLAAAALAKGCGDGDSPIAPPPDPPRPTTVSVSPATNELTALGATVQLTAEVRDQNARVMAGATVTWTSSANSVATVDASGLVTAAGNGSATITAGAGSASGSAVVTVMQSVASVEVSPSVETIGLGSTLQLTAEGFDEKGYAVEGAEFSWQSSDAAVATVDASGLVTGVALGVATITASAGSAEGTAEIMVSPNPDRAVLVALYEAADGPNWANNENWLTDAPLGEWYGVETDRSGRVVDLRMAENALSGPIPAKLGDLAHLRYLNLGSNDLTGPIPPELGRLAHLSVLDLGGNRLTGSIPPELGRLAHLSVLHLGANRLTGSIPPELGNLANLNWLQLAGNALTGPIPTEFGGLTNLQTLHIVRNALSGPLPRSLLELESLRTLTFGSNDGLCAPGTADFSEWLEGLPSSNGPYCNESDRMVLRSLYEAATGTGWSDSRGWLEGVVLDEWYGVGTDPIGRVTELDLNRNGLAGRLPPQLGQMARMTELRIGGNSLFGTVTGVTDRAFPPRTPLR